MVSTHLKNIGQIGSCPQVGVKKNVSNHLERSVRLITDMCWELYGSEQSYISDNPTSNPIT